MTPNILDQIIRVEIVIALGLVISILIKYIGKK